MTSESNAIVLVTPLVTVPGWQVREYASGLYDAAATNGVAVSIGVDSFEAAVCEAADLAKGKR